MAENDPLLPYVLAWEDARAEGRDPPPEELCRDRPELAARLAERIASLRSGEPVPGGRGRRKVAAAPGLNDPRIPAKLAQFQLLGLLGKGGMGAVFRAEDTNLGRIVALKIIHPNQADNLTIRTRFMREARAQAQIEHDNVLPIYHVDSQDGIMFIAMPLLQGETLESRLKRERVLSLGVSLKVGQEVAEGLAAAHAKGLIHRDIKPSNVWLEGDPQSFDPDAQFRRCKILDFGLALPTENVARLTVRGAFLGTPAYMSPEQAGGGKVDGRADLFSLGVMLYEMVVGKDPFFGPTPAAAIVNVATVEPPRARDVNPAIPEDLSDLIAKLVAKQPDRRPGTAREVADAIRAINRRLTNPGYRPPPSGPDLALTMAPSTQPNTPPMPSDAPPGGTIASAGGAYAGTATFDGPPAVKPGKPGRPADDDATEVDTSWRPDGRRRSPRLLVGLLGLAAAAVVVGVLVYGNRPTTTDRNGNNGGEPKEVAVRLTVNAPGAKVRVLGEPAVAATAEGGAWVVRLPADRKRTVRAEADGFAAKEIEVDPASGAAYSVELIPERMRVVLKQLPPGAEPTFPDDPSAKTVPGNSGVFDVLRKPQTVRVKAAGYAEATFPVPVPPAGSDRVEVTAALKADTPPKAFTGPAGIEFRLIPAGKFPIGVEGTADKVLADQPVREVVISQPFYLGKHEVTRGQFRKFVDETGHKTEAEESDAGGFGYVPGHENWFKQAKRYSWRETGLDQTDDHPVVNVTWNDAKEFCVWLSRKDGRRYRLPTEAEWEYAARSGPGDRLPPADPDAVVGVANVADATARRRFDADNPKQVPKCFKGEDGFAFTAPVGKLPANGHGLHDMYGNVVEWCEDWYGPVDGLPKSDPIQTTRNENNRRVARGGAFLTGSPEFLRFRYPVVDDQPSIQIGFRVLVEVGKP